MLPRTASSGSPIPAIGMTTYARRAGRQRLCPLACNRCPRELAGSPPRRSRCCRAATGPVVLDRAHLLRSICAVVTIEAAAVTSMRPSAMRRRSARQRLPRPRRALERIRFGYHHRRLGPLGGLGNVCHVTAGAWTYQVSGHAGRVHATGASTGERRHRAGTSAPA
jgi:hypothetical protein